MCMGDEIKGLSERVVRLETQMDTMSKDVNSIKNQMDDMARKEDIASLQEYFEKRDEHATKQMWRLIFALVAVVGIIALSTFGFTQIPGITRLFKIGG
jgi:hypothetical protein